MKKFNAGDLIILPEGLVTVMSQDTIDGEERVLVRWRCSVGHFHTRSFLLRELGLH